MPGSSRTKPAVSRTTGQASLKTAPARPASTADRKAGATRVDPAFHRAILKIALELKKPRAASYDAIVAETIRSMRLDAEAFRHHLGENGGHNMSLLLATARAGGL